jgi:hypothetical protein
MSLWKSCGIYGERSWTHTGGTGELQSMVPEEHGMGHRGSGACEVRLRSPIRPLDAGPPQVHALQQPFTPNIPYRLDAPVSAIMAASRHADFKGQLAHRRRAGRMASCDMPNGKHMSGSEIPDPSRQLSGTGRH